MAEDFVAALCWQLRALNLPEGQREYRFHITRRWRFDLAWPELKLALEVDGGRWIGGRHTTGTGIYSDSQKMSEAAVAGWRVLRVTPDMVVDGQAAGYVERALGVLPKTMIQTHSGRVMTSVAEKVCAATGCMTMIGEDKERCQFHS